MWSASSPVVLGHREGQPDVLGEGEEPLLGAVVQVALQRRRSASPVSTILARDACSSARCASASACEALVLEAESDGGTQLSILGSGASRRERPRRLGRSSRTSVVTLRAWGRPPAREPFPPLRIHERVRARKPVRDTEVCVPHGSGERRFQRSRRRCFTQVVWRSARPRAAGVATFPQPRLRRYRAGRYTQRSRR